MKPHQIFSCEICFLSKAGAAAAMAELTEHGIETKIFEGIVDPLSSETVFVGAWREGTTSFEKIVIEIAEQHNGSADSFGVDDHEPVPSDFGFTPPEAA